MPEAELRGYVNMWLTMASVVLSSGTVPTTNDGFRNVDVTRWSCQAVSIFSSERVICIICTR
jgi:hypothetical protein